MKRPLRVLVVDPCPDTVETTAMLLHLWGHEARTAPDNRGAVEAAANWKPDVLLTELSGPGLDGCALANHFRQGPDGQRRLLVALTGYGSESHRRRTFHAGFDCHLLKPAEPGALWRLLDTWRRSLFPARARIHAVPVFFPTAEGPDPDEGDLFVHTSA